MVGRDASLEAARSLLAHPSSRLVTITGPAGVGKSWFAANLLRSSTSPADRKAITVDLAALRTPDELDAEVARAAGVIALQHETVSDAVVRWFDSREIVLLLDGAEHLVGIGPRVAAWLGVAPGLRVIVTSRQRLNLSIETEIELTPLATRSPAIEGQPLSPAGRLFALLAGAHAPDELDPQTVMAIERLADRLDGLPLALDLVAARLDDLDPQRIATLLESTDALARSLPGVASALDLAVTRSYGLVSPNAQRLLQALTVFTGGFSIEIAERLIGGLPELGIAIPEVAILLDELGDHHLIMYQTMQGRTPRFTMLGLVAETMRRWHGSPSDRARAALARAAIAFAEAREYSGFVPGREHEIAELADEFHNLMAAIDWLHDQGQVDQLVQLVGALNWYWYTQGHYAFGVIQFERTLARSPAPGGYARARFQLGYGMLLDLMGRFDEASDALQESRAYHQELGISSGAAATGVAIGFNALHRGQHDAAHAALEDAIHVARSIPERETGHTLEAVALANIGVNAHERGDTVTAEGALRRAVDLDDRLRFRWGAARGRCDLGGVLRDAGKPIEALDTYQRALDTALPLGDHRLIAVALAGVAALLAQDGQARVGAWLFGGVAALRPIAGQPSFLRANERAWEAGRAAARAALGPKAFTQAWAIGARTELTALAAFAGRATLLGPHPFPPVTPPLTRQERSVFRMVLQDVGTGLMADLIGVSERTVHSHISSLFHKYHVNSRLELLALASRHRGSSADD